MFLLFHVLTCHSQVLQDLGLPTGSEPKSEFSGEAEGESVKTASTASTTSEDVCTSVPFIKNLHTVKPPQHLPSSEEKKKGIIEEFRVMSI